MKKRPVVSKSSRQSYQEIPHAKRYLFWIVLALLIIVSYFILKPYLIALISALILAYLFMPLYSLLSKKLPKHVAAAFCLIIIACLLFISFTIILANVINQAYTLVDLQSFKTFASQASSTEFIQKIGLDLNSLLQRAIALIISIISSLVSYLPSLIATLTIAVIGCYFILINWDTLISNLKDYIPLKNKDTFISEIEQTTKGIVYGYFFIALLEFIITALAFYFLGLKTYALIATIIFFFAFIPFLGPTIVWLPIMVYQLAIGNYYLAVGILVVGIILSFFIDFLLKAQILGKQTKINPFVMLLGVLGGVSIFGIFGFVLGPLILSYTLKFLHETLK